MLTPRQQLVWLCLAITAQLTWGIYPDVVRYLQTKRSPVLTSLQLGFLLNLIGLPALFLAFTLPALISDWRKKRAARASSDLQEPLLNGSSASPKPEGTPSEDADVAALDGERPSALRFWLDPAFPVLCGTTIAMTAVLMCQLYSLKLTQAYLSQMCFLLAPVFVSLMSRFLFKQPLPQGLGLAVALMIFGSFMVLYGKYKAARKFGVSATDGSISMWAAVMFATWGVDAHKSGLHLHDIYGMGLALLSAVALATFMLIIQRHGTLVSFQSVLASYFALQVALCYVLTRTLEAPVWWHLYEMDWVQW
jgi:drug/metabolite transporter (DMT)-like permease